MLLLWQPQPCDIPAAQPANWILAKMLQEIGPSDFGKGLLRDRTTAVQAYLQTSGVDTQVLRGTELIFGPSSNVTPEWGRLLLTNCQEPTAMA